MAKQKPPVPVRLSDELLFKFDVVCKARRRKRGELLRLLAEDVVAEYEATNGPIQFLPSSPATSTGGQGQ